MNIYQKKLEEGEKLKAEMSPKVREMLETTIGEIRQIIGVNGLVGTAALIQVYHEVMLRITGGEE